MPACTLPCTECSGGPTSCTNCDSSLPYLYSNDCYPSCPTNTYEESGACYGINCIVTLIFIFIDCISPCQSCTNDLNCQTCEAGFTILFEQRCYTTCPPGTYAYSSSCDRK